jgi:hypothetical protein
VLKVPAKPAGLLEEPFLFSAAWKSQCSDLFLPKTFPTVNADARDFVFFCDDLIEKNRDKRWSLSLYFQVDRENCESKGINRRKWVTFKT